VRDKLFTQSNAHMERSLTQ